MTEDMHDLVRTALLEPDGDPPVEELARRGRARRRRRHAALAIVPVLALVAGLLVVPALFDERVELAPAEPGATGGGWPVQVRYERVDLMPTQAERSPDLDLDRSELEIVEFAGSSWQDWVRVRVAVYEMHRGGLAANVDGTPRHGLPERREVPTRTTRVVGDQFGELGPGDERLPADVDTPFAALDEARVGHFRMRDIAAAADDPEGAADPQFRQVTDPHGQPGVRVLDEGLPETFLDERERLVGQAIDLDPADLSAALYDEPYCLAPPATGAECAARADALWFRWTHVWHTPTGIPLYSHWAGPDFDSNPEALSVTTLRVTHLRLSEDPAAKDEHVEDSAAERGGVGMDGWPAQVRYEEVDVHYVEVKQVLDMLDTTRLRILEFGGNSWRDWVAVQVASYQLEPEGLVALPSGEPRGGVGERQGSAPWAAVPQRFTGDQLGGLGPDDPGVPTDPDTPFVTLQAAWDADFWLYDVEQQVSVGAGPQFGPVTPSAATVPGARRWPTSRGLALTSSPGVRRPAPRGAFDVAGTPPPPPAS